MTLNWKLIREVREAIDTHPESWKQEQWRCASGMCFAGWAVELTPTVDWLMPAKLLRELDAAGFGAGNAESAVVLTDGKIGDRYQFEEAVEGIGDARRSARRKELDSLDERLLELKSEAYEVEGRIDGVENFATDEIGLGFAMRQAQLEVDEGADDPDGLAYRALLAAEWLFDESNDKDNIDHYLQSLAAWDRELWDEALAEDRYWSRA